ncbi:uncharacterized protein LOC123557438 [Mercenaria mercenaria]|uniref:uncharacterized protein LOC123557438 n=1 Tax=Mercenaria mercenaria TaxID=6596 RepID=UPI00234F5A77|nr:uncharacterized protein LOC123557438 [Mercenaria mercenaria]
MERRCAARRKVHRCLALSESQNTNRKHVSLISQMQYQWHADHRFSAQESSFPPGNMIVLLKEHRLLAEILCSTPLHLLRFVCSHSRVCLGLLLFLECNGLSVTCTSIDQGNVLLKVYASSYTVYIH